MNRKKGQAAPIVLVIIMLLLGGAFILTQTLKSNGPESNVETQTGPTFPISEDYYTSYEGEDGRTYVNKEAYDKSQSQENPDFFNPDEEYIPEVVYDNTAPALSDVEIDDGLAETNSALDERVELKEKVPVSQALPQPVEETVAETEAKIEDELQTVSKYLDMVTMNATNARRDDPNAETIVLTSGYSNETNINITGWKFRSAVTGRTIDIGKATKLFISGASGSKENIIIAPRGKVTFISGRSPIGSDFVVNKCTGYLSQFQTFTPYISTSCPEPEDEIVFYDRDPSIFIDNDCMDFVERISRCKIVDTPFPPEITPMCREAIVENIGYNVCVNRHRNEEDFWTLDQRVYLKQGSEIWRNEREVIELIDEDGFVVDFYDY